MASDFNNSNEQEGGENIEKETSQARSQNSEDDSSLNGTRLTLGSIVSIASLFMFVGGALVTLILLAKAFELHGQALVVYVIGACALVLGLAGYLITNIMGDKPVIGAGVGFIFGGFSALVLYLQTQHYSWWQ